MQESYKQEALRMTKSIFLHLFRQKNKQQWLHLLLCTETTF